MSYLCSGKQLTGSVEGDVRQLILGLEGRVQSLADGYEAIGHAGAHQACSQPHNPKDATLDENAHSRQSSTTWQCSEMLASLEMGQDGQSADICGQAHQSADARSLERRSLSHNTALT